MNRGGRRSRSRVRRAGQGLSAVLGRGGAWKWVSCSSSLPARLLELDRKVGEAIDIYVNDQFWSPAAEGRAWSKTSSA